MKLHSVKVLFAGVAGAVSLLLVCGAAISSSSGREGVEGAAAAKITVDYPREGSVFPPEITPPTFLWHDSSGTAARWVIEVTFAGRPDHMRMESAGELLRLGVIDPEAGPAVELTAEQASSRTWRPDAET